MTALANARTTSGSDEAEERRRPARLSRLAVGGLALAVLAETGSLGLLGLSGWFIAACAVAGATLFSTFSYIAPSGGVRSFALLRIGASYGQRIVQHAAVLRVLGKIRLQFFNDAALVTSRRSRPLRDGSVLDRALNDTETESMSLITVISPLTVFVVTGTASVLVAAMVSPPAAAVLAAGALASILLSWNAVRHRSDDVVRGAARAELVTAIDAWPELVSLGAADRLVARSSQAVGRLAGEQARSNRRETSIRSSAAALAVVALALAAGASVLIDRVGAPSVALVLLLGTGMLGVAGRAGEAFDALAAVRAARNRRVGLLASGTLDEVGLPAISVVVDDHGMRFDGYRLPEGVLRVGERILSANLDRGSTLVVTGPSGSGKTTFLDSLADALGNDAVQVPIDDHIFTGTVASNLRLAFPEASDEQLVGILGQMRLTAVGINPSTLVGVGGRALSGGEQTRLRLARAVLAQPRVLIADEPVAGLDDSTAHAVLQLLRTILPDAVLVLSLHYLDQTVRDALGDVQLLQLD
ncbi:MAG: ATP-binding cassette, subfamily bacterial CydC [Actinomycetota bacterium]|nr:ATP-binding cassette, subfamily bacterial CydC [Actinomycetota bacterium]